MTIKVGQLWGWKMAAALKQEHSAFSEGTCRRIQSRHTFINVATCEMPRIVPKFISAPEMERGEGPIQVRNCSIYRVGPWNGACSLDLFFVAVVEWVTQLWQATLFLFCLLQIHLKILTFSRRFRQMFGLQSVRHLQHLDDPAKRWTQLFVWSIFWHTKSPETLGTSLTIISNDHLQAGYKPQMFPAAFGIWNKNAILTPHFSRPSCLYTTRSFIFNIDSGFLSLDYWKDFNTVFQQYQHILYYYSIIWGV